MKFSIRFLPDKVPDLEAGEKAAYGLIQVGHFEERFIASLNFWKTGDYQKQWIRALTQLLDQKTQSCLITSLTNPQETNFITWWPIYCVGKTLYFQNQILFMANLATPFDPGNPYGHIPPRKKKTEDGQRISEWSLSIDDVRNFLTASAS